MPKKGDVNSMFDMSGKVALVTGGRRGLGLAMAQGLAEAGALLAVVASSKDCRELRAAIEGVSGGWMGR